MSTRAVAGLDVACPECDSGNTVVYAVKRNEENTKVRRYRRCKSCGHRFRTTQFAERYDDAGFFWDKQMGCLGVKNGNSVFTPENIMQMRVEHAEGMSTSALSKIYGCNQKTVWDIVNRKTWKHIA